MDKVLDIGGITFSAILTATQTNEVFRLISLILTILTTLVVLARNIYNWYKDAKLDGKIDKDELKDLINIVGDGIEDINNCIEEEVKKDGDTKAD